MRSTESAEAISHADEGGARIERLKMTATGAEEIRFSWWKAGRLQARPLDLPEDELLRLVEKAIDGGVFSEGFVENLERMLREATRPALPEHAMVTLVASVDLEHGRTLPAGARGAVVFVHGDGAAYEVEFIEPFHAVATVPARNLARSSAA